MTTLDHSAYSNVWLASYPKSGNTWFRLIWRELTTGGKADEIRPAFSPQPGDLQASILGGLDLRQLSGQELLNVRAELEKGATADAPPILRKTHERFMHTTDGAEVFPVSGTRCAVVLIRDPRDVVLSYARHYSFTIEESAARLSREVALGEGISSRLITAGGPGAWWQHLQSWLDGPTFPVQVFRYEDFRSAPVNTFFDAVRFCGLDVTRDEVAAAVEACDLTVLRQREQEQGFAERLSPQPFFGEGLTGGWKGALSSEQISVIEAANGNLMTEFGYELAGH